MVFSSVTFLFFFLPAALAVYALAPRPLRNVVLLLISLVFYTWGSGAIVGVLFVSVIVDYVLGFVAAAGARLDDHRLRRLAITASVVVNLSLLAWFKYAGWLIENAADAGLYSGAAPDIVLPIGISFFTFQSMSYTIDVARGRCDHLVNPIDFALYVTLFPQLIAGPIVRYHEIEPEIRRRDLTTHHLGEGAVRFGHGLVKKLVIADTVGVVADAAFGADELTMGAAWVGALAYTMQIYFDFSGYSDMAIGLGKMFGFTIPENFARPYSAVSVTDFWRRWHITLSNWFRDYLYIPLGGGRGRPAAVYRNLMIVFLLTGLWHGANWTFVVWGIYHGGWLLLERRFGWRNVDNTGAQIARRATTLLIVVVGWVIFRADSLGAAADHLGAMVSFDDLGLGALARSTSTRAVLTLLGASLVVFLPRDAVTGPILVTDIERRGRIARTAILGVGLPFALLLAASGAFSPFLYFQF
ncbi:MAG: alginate O-acetyltransferase [Acidimicrobiales bacterium]|nr:MAG: alginate O-acetyltransferase [Acidimicrobiales bacterium]